MNTSVVCLPPQGARSKSANHGLVRGDTVVADDYVSTNHARLVPRGDSWVLEDLGSTNGTFLDRTKVTAPTPVPLGVPIRIGKTTLELRK